MQNNYRIVDASERFSRLDFTADVDWETYPESIYTCAGCGERTSFVMRDFARHRFSDFTNLSGEDAREIGAAALIDGAKSNSFLDFYCPRCRLPARVHYVAWAGGRYTNGYHLSYVVERKGI